MDIYTILKVLIEIALATGVIAFLAKKAKSHLRKNAESKFNDGVVDRGRVYELIRDLKVRTGAKRITINLAENGGGIPRIDAEVYITMLYEVFADDGVESPMKPMVIRLPADEFHSTRVLSPLADPRGDGTTKIRVEKMRPSLMKDMYESLGYKYSVAHKLHSSPSNMIYIALLFDHKECNIGAEARVAMATGINNLRREFGKKDV